MAKNARYNAPYRRRKQGKTDYAARKGLVLSGKPRIVIRGTVKNMTAQIITAKPDGDVVLVSAHSRELSEKYGWKGPGTNISAAYLVGLLCGVRAKAKGNEEAIADIGLHSPSKGARVFAVLKGAVDGGVNVPHSEEKLPSDDRIKGEHIGQYAKSLASEPDVYQMRFSKYVERKLNPEDLPGNFAETKKNIMADFKTGGKTA